MLTPNDSTAAESAQPPEEPPASAAETAANASQAEVASAGADNASVYFPTPSAVKSLRQGAIAALHARPGTRLELILRSLQALYLFRVPFAIIVSMLALTWLALFRLEALMGNLVKGLSAWECLGVAFFATVAAVAANFSAAIIGEHGPKRFFDRDSVMTGFLALTGAFLAGLAVLAVLCLVVATTVHSTSHWWIAALASWGGMTLGVAAAGLCWALYHVVPGARAFGIEDKDEGRLTLKTGAITASPPHALAASPHEKDNWDDFRDWLDGKRTRLEDAIRERRGIFWWLWYNPIGMVLILVALVLSSLRAVIVWLVQRKPGPGYFPDEQAKAKRQPYREHVFATSLLAGLLVAYFVTGYLKITNPADEATLPTLAYLCLAGALLCLLLSTLTFFIDRWLGAGLVGVACLLVLLLITPGTGWTDHVFDFKGDASADAPTAAAVLEAKGSQPAIVVAAAGGGIQAAAWTATVLSALDQDVPNFRGAVRAVSGVSGGAVGSMYYLNSFPAPRLEPGEAQKIREDAIAESLDEIAASWAFVEPLRILPPFFFFPSFRLNDRGHALERTFAARLNPDLDKTPTLDDWSRTHEQRPAAIFSAVVAETGRPFLFTTTEIPDPRRNPSSGDAPQYEVGPRNVRVSTAVRLSATFPFVTPAARPNNKEDHSHLVDGGYYDNYGVTSLGRWLDSALEGASNGPERILVLQIRSFPPKEQKFKKRDWVYQFVAPADALLSVRQEAQRIRNQDYLRLLANYWRTAGRKVELECLTVDYAPDETLSGCYDHDPPLSWRLRPDQQDCLARAWAKSGGGTVSKVREFLGPAHNASDATACPEGGAVLTRGVNPRLAGSPGG